MDRLRSKLASLSEQRAELSDSEVRLRELEALPNLIEEYLKELPHLLDLKPLLREYEPVRVEPTIVIPVEAKEPHSTKEPIGIYRVTPESARQLSEEELAEKHRAVEEKRARRFRELSAMLDLKVVYHKDRSLEVTWGTHCHEWLGRWAHASWDNGRHKLARTTVMQRACGFDCGALIPTEA